MNPATDNAYRRISTRIGNARWAISDNLQMMRRRIDEHETAIRDGLDLPHHRFGDLAAALDDTIAAERAWQTARKIVESAEDRYADAGGPPAPEPADAGTLRERVWAHIVAAYQPEQLFLDRVVAEELEANRQSVNWVLWRLWRDGALVKLEDVTRRDRNDDYVRYAYPTSREG